jgi:hypothetical protein
LTTLAQRLEESQPFVMAGRDAYRALIHTLANPYLNQPDKRRRDLWEKGHRMERKVFESGGQMTRLRPTDEDVRRYAATHPVHSCLGPTRHHPRRQTPSQQPQYTVRPAPPIASPAMVNPWKEVRVTQTPEREARVRSRVPEMVKALPEPHPLLPLKRVERFNQRHRTAV